MKRQLCILLGLLAVVPTVVALGQGPQDLEPISGYIRSDLHLISQESKPDWSPRWTGPIQAATNLAWMHDHGYARFLRDFNQDGVIDELDTIELADDLGTGPMRTETPVGTNDARLVIGLAQYVAERYPDEFILKIYDAGFPEEFRAERNAPFAEDAIPGIELRLMSEPTLEAYQLELETAEGVIVGLEESEGRNTYLSGRSFLYETTPAGHTPVDLAWAEEDRFAPGTQGRVLETLARHEERLEFDFRMGWTLVECMLALSPLDPTGEGSEDYICPPDAIAYHVAVSPTPFGDVEIEECVLREEGFDTYIWILRNLDFESDGCGVCTFGVSNDGLHAVSESGPSFWTFTETVFGWFWDAPGGSCGIEAGSFAVFRAVVPAPTMDAWVPAIVGSCVPPLSIKPPIFPVRTTGPRSMDEGECPDIELEVDDHGCTTLDDGTLRITVWPAVVRNIGGSDITTGFSVTAFAPGYSGSASTMVAPPLAAGASFALPPLVFEIPAAEAPDPACPITVRVVADSSFAVLECTEENNTVEFEECCPGGPNDRRGACCFPDGSCAEMNEGDCLAEGGDFQGAGTTCATVECPTGDECPDLTVSITLISCECEQVPGTNVFEVSGSARVRVSNIGTAASPSISDGLVFEPGGEERTVPGLNPSGFSTFTFEFSETVQSCRTGGVTLTATVDPDDDVVECNEGNNEASLETDCD